MKEKKGMFWLLIFLFLLFLPSKVQAWGIKASWDPNTEPDLAGYNVYISTTYENASQKIGDIAEFSLSVDKPCFCYDGISSNLRVVFIALVAHDTEGLESTPTIGYSLVGNIWGTFNDGVSYTNARVDGQDLTSLGLYFGSFTSHQEIDCSGTFSIEIPSLDQRSDFDQSNRIDGLDLIKLGLCFGNMAQ